MSEEQGAKAVDVDPIARIEALPYGDRCVAALDTELLRYVASFPATSLEYARIRARLRGCGALPKGWDARVALLRPKVEPGDDRWEDELRRGEEGKPVGSPLNAGLILRHWPPLAALRLNQLTLEAEIDGRAWRDGDTFRWQEQIERTWSVGFSREVLESAVEAVAEERGYHPLRERIEAIEWDGHPRIKLVPAQILDCHEPLAARMVECLLIGAVARIMKPGEKVDEIFTLYSAEQGRKKTTFFEVLAYDRVYIGPFDPSNKDHVMAAATSVFNVLDECDEMTGRMEWPAIKRFASMRADSFRPPYGRRVRRFPRGFVNVATTNKNDFLRDETGNRRWHILPIGPADPDVRMRTLEDWRDQLWAEAMHLWRAGTDPVEHRPRAFLWWLTPQEEARRAEGAKAYEDRSLLDEKLEEWLAAKATNAELRMAEILDQLGVPKDKQPTAAKEQRAAGAVLRRLGWVQAESAMIGQRGRVWRRK